MSMKVAFLGGARYSQPLDDTGEKKFRALNALGELFVIGFSEDLYPRYFTQHAQFCLLPKLPLPILRYAEMFILGPCLVVWLIFRHGVQILVAQSPYEGFVTAMGKKIASLLGRKVVLVIESHGDFEESLFLQRRILSQRLYRSLMRHAAGYAIKNAELLRAVSNSTKQQLKQLAPNKAIFQFYTWTDIDTFLRIGRKKVVHPRQDILFAGVLIPRKGVHHLINAFGQIAQDFPQTRLIIIGREENRPYTAELKTQAQQLGLHGRVQFFGEVPQAELSAWMYRAGVFVLPTYSEGLPRVVFEAMAAGSPVVASAVSGIPEILKDGKTGFLVPPGDEAALADRLRRLLENPSKAAETGQRAKTFAERFFSAEAYVQGYRQIFEMAQTLLKEPERHNASSSL